MKDQTHSVDFSQLILGFSSAALYYMGHTPIGEKTAPQANLPLATQNIDIIAILKDKTKGNLTADEQLLLEQVLADLQLKYVEASSKKNS